MSTLNTAMQCYTWRSSQGDLTRLNKSMINLKNIVKTIRLEKKSNYITDDKQNM